MSSQLAHVISQADAHPLAHPIINHPLVLKRIDALRETERPGKALERAILVNAAKVGMTIEKTDPKGVFIPGGEKIVKRGFVDCFGCVSGGRMICFEAKETSILTKFKLNDESHFRDHQRKALIKFGEAGAIAGLLIASTFDKSVSWIDWQYLRYTGSPLQWTNIRWITLATEQSAGLIQFERVPGVCPGGER